MSLTIHRDENHINIVSPFWQVTHDLARGGAITDVRITHGSNRNLLTAPVSAAVDSYSECWEDKPGVVIKATADNVQVTFSGFLKNVEGRHGGIRYEHAYLYTLYRIRNELRIVPAGSLALHSVTACAIEVAGFLNEYVWGSTDFAELKPRYMEQIGPHYEDVWGALDGANGALFSEGRRPWQVSLFSRGREGLSWVGDSKQYAWDSPVAGQSLACYSLTKHRDSATVTLSPIRRREGQSRVSVDRPLEFSWYLILPNVRERGRRKLLPVFFGSNPFPCDAQLEAMAKSGVNVLSAMDDVDYRGQTIHHWHDGEFPPYPPAKMKELARFIKRCHGHHMAVVPYFAGRILSAETRAFAGHARDWYASAIPEGQLRYHPGAMAGSNGCFVCPDSAWIDFLERYIKRCVGELGFDGCYLDYCAPGVCFNPRHLPGEHNMTDGLVRLLERLRGWLGDDRLMMGHAGGESCWLMLHNICDGIVTLEEGKRDNGMFSNLDEYPPSVSFMGSGSVSWVPNAFFHRPDSTDKRRLLHLGVAHAALLNAAVYPYTFWYDRLGYDTWQAAFADPDGVYAMYSRLRKIDFTKYRFFDPWSGVARTNRKDVHASIYVGDREAIIVAGNFSSRAVGGVVVNVHIVGKTGLVEKQIRLGPLKANGIELKQITW